MAGVKKPVELQPKQEMQRMEWPRRVHGHEEELGLYVE